MTAHLDRDITRLESFSDAVFGFVATLLVVSIDVPTDFSGLLDRLAGFPGFAVGFLVLTLFWARHRAFFKRFGHYDGGVLLANAAVLLSLLLFSCFPSSGSLISCCPDSWGSTSATPRHSRSTVSTTCAR